MWHTESIDKNIFEVLQQSDVFDVAVGLYTGGLPQRQQRGTAEFMTASYALWRATQCLDLLSEKTH